MRIIGGFLGGRKFYPPAKNWPTRPTTDFSKEALYNILQNRMDFESVRFLDLFGGTGNHSFELISRGCTDAHYVDKFNGACRFVREQAQKWEIEDHITIHKSDAFQFLKRNTLPFDYIFAGPPYPLPNIPEIPNKVLNSESIAAEGLLVLEHNQQHQFSGHPKFEQERTYGGTHFSFFIQS